MSELPSKEVIVEAPRPEIVRHDVRKRNRQIVVTFDRNVDGPTDCDGIFEAASLQALGMARKETEWDCTILKATCLCFVVGFMMRRTHVRMKLDSTGNGGMTCTFKKNNLRVLLDEPMQLGDDGIIISFRENNGIRAKGAQEEYSQQLVESTIVLEANNGDGQDDEPQTVRK